MMRWLRAQLGNLRLWLFGPGVLLPAADVEPHVGAAPQALVRCTHRRWSACLYRGKAKSPGWYAQCLNCGIFTPC